MIKQILYNCEADCTVLIRKPQVISGGGGAHPCTLPVDPPLQMVDKFESQMVSLPFDRFESLATTSVPFPPEFNVPFLNIVLCTIYLTFLFLSFEFAHAIQLFCIQHSTLIHTTLIFKFSLSIFNFS